MIPPLPLSKLNSTSGKYSEIYCSDLFSKSALIIWEFRAMQLHILLKTGRTQQTTFVSYNLAVNPYKVPRALWAMLQIFHQFCVANIDHQSGWMIILRNLPSSIWHEVHKGVQILVCVAHLNPLADLHLENTNKSQQWCSIWINLSHTLNMVSL